MDDFRIGRLGNLGGGAKKPDFSTGDADQFGQLLEEHLSKDLDVNHAPSLGAAAKASASVVDSPRFHIEPYRAFSDQDMKDMFSMVQKGFEEAGL